ncbi:hypothetical protein G5B30_14420 [Sphingobacterium sp. SGG-5]|uniref:hypothetical protein n=1 Tax=Sphingobacterium sp. SGG-5 TaxID=2710881 RepID=UPI0013EC6FA5|nr:hypothetical protein [Sphingobacterium sp. SGG-5]NGM63102.1 hypothetical protein [Sphingobacterium sp. SGG-5]
MGKTKLIAGVILSLFLLGFKIGFANPEQQKNDEITITVSPQNSQRVLFGIDAERLWFWRSSLKDQLADLAVGQMHTSYVRVGINGAYEREKGIKNEAAYDKILEVMTAMRKANPKIHFFASPRPIHEAYTREEKAEIWGHRDNGVFSPFPIWIQEWKKTIKTRKMKDGTVVNRWVKGEFDVDAWVQYYADYLNLMHKKGFDITYMDATNEQSIVQPKHTKYLSEELPKKLNKGVKMPKIIAPSSWSTLGATKWLKSVDISKGEDKGFAIVASHNTGKEGELVDFVNEVRKLGKEAWNSELHQWVGSMKELKREILTSEIFWEHMRAGYTGIDTWLFYGPLNGQGHTMINSSWKKINRSGKYEIFRQIVNHANEGNYVAISRPSDEVQTGAFIKDGILSVWVLNTSVTPLKSVKFEIPGRGKLNRKIEVVKWHDSLPRAGSQSITKISGDTQFFNDIDGESLYFFKINLEG